MNIVTKVPEFAVIVAEDDKHKLICRTEGFEYVPDSKTHIYGKSTRPPLEDLFLRELEFFRKRYPGYEIFTLGSSCVFGERFVNYLTVCEFEIEDEGAFDNLKFALRDSDQAIRKKFHALWKWDLGGRFGKNIAFMVGHMDFAYFLQHRKEFQGDAHNRYMSSFTTPSTIINSQDYKVLHDGQIVPFDEQKLDEKDRFVFQNFHKIKFEAIRK